MTHDLHNQVQEIKSELRERLAEWEKATKRPWTSDAKPKGSISSGFRHICTVREDDGSDYTVTGKEFEFNALCIARSRTDTPKLLQMMLDEVEWLEEELNIDSKFYRICPFFARKALMASYEERLTAIIATWKGEGNE